MMIKMAKGHNLNIYKYMNYLLERLSKTVISDKEMSKFVPWIEAVRLAHSEECGILTNGSFYKLF